jgi:hypothetical protein
MVDYLGWVATAVVVGSYFCARPERLRRVQMIGAAMWTLYGILIGASPVVTANLLVLGAAAWTARRSTPSSNAVGTASNSSKARRASGGCAGRSRGVVPQVDRIADISRLGLPRPAGRQ